MRPSQSKQQRPRRKFDTEAADIMAAELAADMLNFLTTMYENASTDEEKLDIIMRYASVMRELQRAINRVARAQQRRRRYPGNVETKDG